MSAYGLSRATISRLRHGKLKGKDYVPNIKTIAWIAIGLKLTLDEYYELLYAAYPELEVYPQMINLGYAIYDADKFLYDYGLCTFSSPYD